jgi:tripartite ATP-independent transporter DctM subunit
MEVVGLYLLLPFVAFLLIGVPIAFCLAASSLVFVYFSGVRIPPIAVLTEMYDGISGVALLALPLFILTGELLNRSDITETLVDLASKLVGWIAGGLAHVNVLASMFFAGISGSAIADSAALGPILIPAMVREKFPPAFSAAITAASSIIGPIIPPSIPAIVVGAQLGISVGGLFAAGVVPGILMGFALMLISYVISRRRNYGQIQPFQGPGPIVRATAGALPALAVPFLLLGGILTGVFTPTEAGGVAAFYATLVGFLYYRTLDRTKFGQAVAATARITGSTLIVFACAVIFSRILTLQQMPGKLLGLLLTITDSTTIVILLVVLLFLFVGMFMDALVNMVILGPLLMPILVGELGMHPIQFGIFLIVGLVLGLLTPPVGLCLFICAPIARITVDRLSIAVLPFLAVEIVVLLLIAFVPEITLFLPRLLGFA